MFYMKRKSDRLQSRLDPWSRPESRLLNLVGKALLAGLGHESRQLRRQRILQMHSKRTEGASRPNARATPSFEAEVEFPGTLARTSQTYLKSRFVKRPNYLDVTRYSYVPTATRQAADRRFSGVVSFQFSVASREVTGVMSRGFRYQAPHIRC
jgi:hypothetical protein